MNLLMEFEQQRTDSFSLDRTYDLVVFARRWSWTGHRFNISDHRHQIPVCGVYWIVRDGMWRNLYGDSSHDFVVLFWFSSFFWSLWLCLRNTSSDLQIDTSFYRNEVVGYEQLIGCNGCHIANHAIGDGGMNSVLTTVLPKLGRRQNVTISLYLQK